MFCKCFEGKLTQPSSLYNIIVREYLLFKVAI